MKILGISAFYHDSAAALIQAGEIIAAAQEERFTRRKHDPRFPKNAVQFCLEQGKLTLNDVDYIVFYDKPLLKFERLLETYLAFAPRGFISFLTAIPVWIKEKLFQKDLLIKELLTLHSAQKSNHHNHHNHQNNPNVILNKNDLAQKILFTEHHQSHAASAFYPSPFEEAVVLTMDGVGEWATTSVAIGNNNTLKMSKEIHFPHSIGLLYSAFTYYTGFKVNSGEYKVMGLAPYGEPKYANLILEKLIDLKEDGTFRLNMDYFNYCTGLTMTSEKFDALFGGPPRDPATEPLTQRHMDLAASIQTVTEEIVLRLTRSLAKETGISNLCLAGGVALNCVANGKILRDGAFKRIWIQPAAGDAGGALGAALAAYYDFLGKPRTVEGSFEGSLSSETSRNIKTSEISIQTSVVKSRLDSMKGSYLGPEYAQADIETRLSAVGARFEVIQDDSLLFETTASALAEEKAVGWFQGRMEFGPRALGGRSILGDPRSSVMQKQLNLKVKYRESFRPFAPSVLAEEVDAWFELKEPSPYMLLVANVHEAHRRAMTEEEQKLFGIEKLNVVRSTLPAITHVDYSARVQTVHAETNPRYYSLLKKFKELTGCPVLVNTSFNVRGEPIVCTPEDAFRCFMGTDIEVLVVGNCFLRKEAQDSALKLDYKHAFELD